MAQLLGSDRKENVLKSTDNSLGMARDAISCTQCDGIWATSLMTAHNHRTALLHEFCVDAVCETDIGGLVTLE